MLKGIDQYLDRSDARFECMTDRARLILSLGHEFSVNQNAAHVEPGHILRAIAGVDGGVGFTMLKTLGIDLFALLSDLRDLMPQQPFIDFHPERGLSQASDVVLAAARQAAAELGHRYVGSEHLVIGLLSVPSNAADFLIERGASRAAAMDGVRSTLA